MILVEIKERIGEYMTKLMDMKCAQPFGQKWYEHAQEDVNHRDGSYPRIFTLS